MFINRKLYGKTMGVRRETNKKEKMEENGISTRKIK